MEEHQWILSSLLATVAGGWVELKWQDVDVVTCGFIFNDYSCKFCKPTELMSSYGHCGCDSDLRQGQITSEKKTFRSDLANGHISSVLNASMIGFITTMLMPACTSHHLRRTRS
jgi:hypothetical protein